MNCNCLDKIPKEMLQLEDGKYNGRTVEKASVLDVGYMFASGKNNSYSRLEVQLEGLKKPKVVSLLHAFCPFCGVEIKKSSTETPEFEGVGLA